MFKHILVPLDGSSLAECVLPHVITVAQAFNARVTLLRVFEQPSGSALSQAIDPLEWHLVKTEAEAYLNEVVAHLQGFGLKVQGTLKEGNAAKHIIEFAHQQELDLIILSSHGQSGLSGWNISSVVQKIILRTCTSTLIVRAYQSPPKDPASFGYKHLLVPLDGSQRAENALSPAMILARFYGSQLLLAHLVCKPEMLSRTPLTPAETNLVNQITERNRQEATRYLEQICSQSMARVDLRLHISEGNIGELHKLVELKDVDLVVLSAHGQSGNTKWPYGSVTLSFIVYGTTPLLIVQDLSRKELQKTTAELIAREKKGH
jgi:nucleotide-binding universal stress UspA family protein